MKDGLYIGLISGTSLDAIDAALVEIKSNTLELRHAIDWPIRDSLRQKLIELCQPGDNEIERMGVADRELGANLAEAVESLLEKPRTDRIQIRGIGSHGQTIRHRPADGERPPEQAFTLQIGDPNTLAQLTGITTIGDFRRRDVAAGGQGAPLVPPFHQAIFHSKAHNRIIVNIGGMSNITALPKHGEVTGFDTGPGNILMDCWIQHHKNLRYDKDGSWAASGIANAALLERFMALPWLQQTGPRSTGREDFHLQTVIDTCRDFAGLAAEDVQATLLEFTVSTIAAGIAELAFAPDEIYVCGGGAFNAALMQQLNSYLKAPVQSTEKLGWSPEFVEAAAFAWLAAKTLAGESGNLPSVTNASEEVILGAIFQA